MTNDEQFPYGKTLKDVEEMANCAVLFTGGSPLTIEDQREVARDAIVDLLYEERDDIDEDRLNGLMVRAGQRAVRRAHQESVREVSQPASMAYWFGSRGHVTDFTDALVEKLAVRYAWDQLTWEEQDALALLVQTGNIRSAARESGTRWLGDYHERLVRAREKFCQYLDVPAPKKKISRRTTKAGGSVRYRADKNRWIAELCSKHIGSFLTEEDARLALNLALANAA